MTQVNLILNNLINKINNSKCKTYLINKMKKKKK